jgi:hypothetical protein
LELKLTSNAPATRLFTAGQPIQQFSTPHQLPSHDDLEDLPNAKKANNVCAFLKSQ